MSGVWTEQDQKYWEDKENQFIYNFNLLFTSGDYWDRNPENVKPREEALRKLYKQAIQMQAVVKHEIAELTDKENENYIDHYIDMGHFADPIKARPYLLDGFYHGYNYLKKKIEKQFSV